MAIVKVGGTAWAATNKYGGTLGSALTKIGGTDKPAAGGGPSDLILRYKFDESSSGAVDDSSASGNDGTSANCTTEVRGSGRALIFAEASSGRAQSDANVSLGIKEITLAFWIKRGATTGTHMICELSDSMNNNDGTFAVFMTGSTLNVYIQDGTSSTKYYAKTYSSKPVIDTWTHIAIVLKTLASSSEINTYFDKTLDNGTVATSDRNQFGNFISAKINLGRREAGNTLYTNMTMDDFRIYGRALDADEIEYVADHPDE